MNRCYIRGLNRRGAKGAEMGGWEAILCPNEDGSGLVRCDFLPLCFAHEPPSLHPLCHCAAFHLRHRGGKAETPHSAFVVADGEYRRHRAHAGCAGTAGEASARGRGAAVAEQGGQRGRGNAERAFP